MDYFGFNFDLQLFATNTVTFNDTAKAQLQAEGGSLYYATIDGGETYAWYNTITDLKNAAAAKGTTFTLIAQIANGEGDGWKATLNVVAGADGADLADLTLDNFSPKGVTVNLVQSLTVASGSTTVTKGANVAGAVTAVGHTITVTNAAGFDCIKSDSKLQVTVGSGVKIATNATTPGSCDTYTTTAEKSVLLLSGTKGATVLQAGGVDVRQSDSITVGDAKYTAKADATEGHEAYTTARIEATKGVEWNANGTLKTAASVGSLVAGSGNSVSEITLTANATAANADIIANGATIAATTADKNIIVNSNGVISGLENTTKVVIDGATYTVAAAAAAPATITVSDALSGYYKCATAVLDLAPVTITASGDAPAVVKDTVETVPNTVVPAFTLDTLTLVAASKDVTAPTYYGVTLNAGNTALKAEKVADLAAATACDYGYFKVVSDYTAPKSSVAITYHAKGGTNASKLLSNFTVNFDAVQAVTKTAVDHALTNITVSGISTGTVKLAGVPHTVEANIVGVDTSVAGNVTYTPYAVLSETADTLNLSTAGDKTVRYYKIEKTAGGQYGAVTYSINNTPAKTGTYTANATEVTVPTTGDSYLMVVTTAGTGTAMQHTVSVVLASDPADALAPATNADVWGGLKIVSDLSPTICEKITVDGITSGAVKYAVTAKVGTVIDVTTNAAKLNGSTAAWSDTPSVRITYKIGDVAQDGIVIPAKGGSTVTKYWKLSDTNTKVDGNHAYLLTQADDLTSYTGDYFKVVVATTGATTITYSHATNGTEDSGDIVHTLSGLTTLNETTKQPEPVYVKIDGTTNALEGALTITDGKTGDANHVDYKASVPAGASVIGADETDVIDYATAYVNDAEIDLALVTTVDTPFYFAAVLGAKDPKTGYVSVTAGTPTTTPITDTTVNYFMVTKTAAGAVTVTFKKAAPGDTQIATFAAKDVETVVKLNGDTGIKSVTGTVDGTNMTFMVNGATTAMAAPAAPVFDTADDSYIKTYKLEFAGGAVNQQIDLSGLAADDASVWYTVGKSTPGQGVTLFTFTKADSDPSGGGTVSYIEAKRVALGGGKSKVLIKFNKQGTDTTLEDLAKLSAKDMIPVFANVPAAVTTIELAGTDSAIHYAISKLPADVQVLNAGADDTIDYAKTFVLGTADTLKIPSAAGTYYYAVTATGGNETKGVMEVSIATEALPITKTTTAAQKKEILAGIGNNYYKVVVGDAGNATINYHASATASETIDLATNAKILVKVDASGMKSGATAIIIDAAADGANAGSKVNQYAISGLDYDVATITETVGTSVVTTATKKYVPSYEYVGTITLADDPAGTYPTTKYFTVAAADDGTGRGRTQFTIAPAVGDPGAHYFQVDYSSKYAVSITYVNKDGAKDYDLSALPEDVKAPVSALGLSTTNKTVDTLNINNDDVAYAVTACPTTVTVNKTDNDTVATIANGKLADGQTITLGTEDVAYYALSGDAMSLTLGAKSTTKPANTENYITVKKTGVNYSITYTPAANGEAYALSNADIALTGAKKSTITIDAGAATGAVTQPAVKAASIVTLDAGIVADVINVKSQDVTAVAADATSTVKTISYTTTYDSKKEGVYLIPVTEHATDAAKDVAEIVDGTAVTTTPSGKTNYMVVTVRSSADGVWSADVGANKRAAGADGTLAAGTPYTGKLNLTLPATVTKFDANSTEAFTTINGVVKDAQLKNVNAATTVTTVSTLAKGESVKISATADFANAVTYTSGGGAISVLNAKAVDGKFVVGTTALTGSATGVWSAKVETGYTAGDGKVVVIFKDGEVEGITGLEKGETVTVKMGVDDAAHTYTYAYNGAGDLIVCTNNGKETFAMAPTDATTAATTDILSLGYAASETITTVGKFAWATPAAEVGAYYLEADATGATIKYSDTITGTGKVSNGSTYIKANYNATSDVLTITPATGNAKGLVDPTTTYTGMITVEAENTKVVYEKGANDGFKLAFNNVATTSSFQDLGADDTVATRTDFAATNTVIIKTTEAISGADSNVTYTAAADGQLVFHGSALYSGVVESADGVTLADGSVIDNATDLNTADITVVGGKITKITNLGTTADKKVVIVKDGVTTTFTTGTGGTSVTKTVVAADGSTTKETYDIAANADVWSLSGGAEKYVNNFSWDQPTGVGYFDATAGTAIATGATGDVTVTDDHIYIKAENTYDAKTGNTLTLTPLYAKDGKLEPFATGAHTIPAVTVTADDKKIIYDGANKDFKVTFAGSDADHGVAADSVFTNLGAGDIIKTAKLAKDATVTINGKAYKALALNDQFTIYSESSTSSSIVDGTVEVTDKVTGANATGTIKETLTYTAGTVLPAKDYDGVTVKFAAGTATTIGTSKIEGMEAGSVVTIVNTNLGTGAKSTTTYQAFAKTGSNTNLIVYRTVDGATKYQDLGIGADVAAAAGTAVDANGYTQKAFVWTDSTEATTVTGLFQIANNTATVADQSAAVSGNWQNYGQTYVQAVWTKASGALVLTKQVVGAAGTLSGGTFDNTKDTVTVAVSGGKKVAMTAALTSSRPDVKSLSITGAGAGSVVETWMAKDHIETVSLKTTVYNADGSVKTAAETVTLGGHVYTAGANGAMVIDGAAVTSGSYLLKSGASSANTITAQVEDSAKTTTKTEITYTKGAAAASTFTEGVTAIVSGGLLKNLTGLGNLEQVVVTTTTTTKLGEKTIVSDTYLAKKISAPGKPEDGYIEVTKTSSDGKIYTHTFAKEDSDLLSSSVAWEVSQQSTTSTFNWNNTVSTQVSYFEASLIGGTGDDKDQYKATISDQTGAPVTITKANKGKYYVKVTSTKDITGKVTLETAELVKVQENGTFAAAETTKVLGKLLVDATVGTLQPDVVEVGDHSIPVVITPKTGLSYKGLLAGDTVEGATAVAIQVNGTPYATAAAAYIINGDGTVRKGTFTVTDGGLKDEIGGTKLEYTKGTEADGVTVTVTYTAAVAGPPAIPAKTEITSIQGLGQKESVKLTAADGTVTTYTAEDALSPTVVTKTVVVDGVTETWEGTMAAGGEVLVPATAAYHPTNVFDFGATTAGKVGYFKLADTIPTSTFTAAPTDGAKYVRVMAEPVKDSSGKTTSYTITSLKELQYVAATGAYNVIDGVGDTINITSPGSLTLAENAIVLPAKDTKRDFKIAITGAKADETYTGFAVNDTVTFGALAQDAKVKVGNVEWKLPEAAGIGATVLYGDGTAKSGKFTLDSTYKSLSGTDGAGMVSTVTATGSGALKVTFGTLAKAGQVTEIVGLADGATATVKTKTAGGVETTTTYAAKDAGDGTYTITKTVTADGVTTISTATGIGKTGGAAANVVGDGMYDDPSASVSADFDWTVAKGSGYFLVGDLKDTTEIGTLEIKPTKTTITKDDAGKYYLKVALDGNGSVSAVTLEKVGADGTLSKDAAKLAAITKGTLNITAPTTKVKQEDGTEKVPGLMFNRTALTIPATINVNITEAANGSTVANLQAGDTMATATLAAPTKNAKDELVTESVTVNGKEFVAAASGAMSFANDGQIVTGTLYFSNDPLHTTAALITAAGKDAKTAADDVTVSTAIGGTDVPVVTVKNGEVTAVSGLKTTGSTVQVTIAGSGSATYAGVTGAAMNISALTITAGKTYKTVPLANGTTITGQAFVAGSEAAAITFANDGGTAVVSGTILFTGAAGTKTATLAGRDTTKATDNTTLTLAKAVATSNVAVTVQDGDVKKIEGLGKGDSVKLSIGGHVTEYKVDAASATKITKEYDGKVVGTAYITAGGDVLGANYLAPGEDITSEDNAIVGQLSWGDISGRSTGYFKVTEPTNGKNTATIVEQPAKVAATAPAGKNKVTTALYAVANASTNSATGAQTLTIDALRVEKDANDKQTVKETGAKLLTAATKLTITAPTAAIAIPDDPNQSVVPALIFDKGTAVYGVTINKAAAGSTFTSLDMGDKVTTATLKAATYNADGTVKSPAETITFDGNIYQAGANGTMTFVGEGDGTADTPTNAARLLSGTLQLDKTHLTAALSGATEAKDIGLQDDVTVAFDDTNTAYGPGNAPDKVIVKASNGVVTSVTGLVTKNATVTVTTGTGDTAQKVRYTVVDNGGTMIARQTATGTAAFKDLDKDDEATYKAITKGKELYDAKGSSYKPWASTTNDILDFTSQGKKVSYIALEQDLWANKTLAKTGDGSDLIKDTSFKALQDNYYLRVTTNTNAKGTTVTAIDLLVAGATGLLAAPKAVAGVTPSYRGTLTLNSATGDSAYAKVTYALPKTRTWTLNATVAAGSSFTGTLKQNDKIATADSTYTFPTDGKSFTLYKNGEVIGTDIATVSYAGKDGATAKVTGGILAVTGLATNGEKVTVVDNKENDGLVTREYLVQKDGKIQLTITAADGTKTVQVSEAAATADTNVIAADYGAIDKTKTMIVSDFDWTLDKSSTGYFAVGTNGTAAVKKGKTTISTAAQKALTYIAVELDGTAANDGVVKSVKAMKFDTETGAMKELADPITNGKITITAPTSVLTFDRANVSGTSISDNVQIAITGAAANSAISGLIARSGYANCDSVTTAALNALVLNADGTVKTAAQGVMVNGNWYTAGAKGALGFTVQNVGDFENLTTLTSGTISLTGNGTDILGSDIAYVGQGKVTANSLTISVKATTTNAGVTSYTVGDVTVGDVFTVEETVGGEKKKFFKNDKTLFYEYTENDETKYKAYAIGAAKTVTSKVLNDTANAKTWKVTDTAFTDVEGDNNVQTAKYYNTLTVDLATLDKRIAADTKANGNVNPGDRYNFVVDKYLVAPAKKQNALGASVVNRTDGEFLNDVQMILGNVANGTVKQFTATNLGDDNHNIGVSIKATAGWQVTGSAANDTITGASSGKDTLRGGNGDDLLVGGGAEDIFRGGNGNDTVKGYATGKDIVAFGAVESVSLTGADVLLWNDANGDGVHDADENSTLLVGMGNGKAVTIMDGTLDEAGNEVKKTYYFGNGKATKGSASFAFTDGAYYYGNKALTNTVKLSTDKTKATKTTLGDKVTIDMNAVDANAVSYFNNIGAIDASASGNRVDITAAQAGATLKGGTYQSTLRGAKGTDILQGGSGADMFWFEALSGNDTIKSYAAKNDAIYLGEWDGQNGIAAGVNGVTVAAAANNKDIELKHGDETMKVEGALGATKALRISKDGTQANTLSYYVGSTKANAANTYTATLETDTAALGTDAAADGATSMKSYYVGSVNTAKDTLKLASKTAITTWKSGDDTKMATFSLQSANLASIDALDASGLKAGSTLKLIGGLGDCTLKGSTSNKSFETFSVAYDDKATAGKLTTVQNLTAISDVIELAIGVTATIDSSRTKGNNTYYTLKNGDDVVGSLLVSGVASKNLSYTAGDGATKASTIKRTV